MMSTTYSNDIYCPLPFKHAFVDSTGISPCCQISRQKVTLEQWHNNPTLIDIQQKMLRNEAPESCSKCYQDEAQGFVSLRKSYLSDYNHERYTTTEIDFVDYRYSNVCNFKCRTCAPTFSHQIHQEIKQHAELDVFWPNSGKKYVSMDTANSEWITKNLQNLQRIMFTGGEPTVIPEVRKILERLLEVPNCNTKILLTTNASFKDNFWTELCRKLPNRLHWTLSIDAVGATAEIVRHGTDWSVVEKNARWLASNAESVDINTVISNLNVMSLYSLLEFVCELKESSKSPLGQHGDQGLRHQLQIVTQDRISAINWPEKNQDSVIKHLDLCLNLPLDDEQQRTIIALRNLIKSKTFEPKAWMMANKYHTALDRIRQEDHTKLLP